jgi:putative colanic acid biosynthesis acetyltransferase WcaF
VIIQNNDPFTQPSFSLSNRLARGIWGIIWLILFRPSPKPFHRWRSFLLVLFGSRIGNNVNVYPDVRIWAPWQLQIGNRVGIANGVTLYSMAPITIGDNCVISQGAHLCAGSHDIDSNNFQLIAKPIHLEEHVWVCADAFIGPGVSVAEGCVLGARAVVTKSISQSWSVWIGNPAAFKRARRKVEVI